jgi:murein L,D-transpeptidase YafK
MKMIFIFLVLIAMQQPSFKETQLKEARVKKAYEDTESIVKKYFSDKKLSYVKFQLFLRAFKKEEKLEVWIKENTEESFVLLHTYDFCTNSGTLGPKRKRGDLQIPEGVYHINHFNPLSNFYLSLGLNYPNASDKILANKKDPGSSIYIHGDCVSIGCIPITNDYIKELYVIAVEARNNGQEKIPVHVFPTRLEAGVVEELVKEQKADDTTSAFWKNLEPVYLDFQLNKKLKLVRVNSKGQYYF